MPTALLAYYALLMTLVFAWPTWRLWRRERVNALVLPDDDSPEAVIGVWFKRLIAAAGIVLIVSASGVPQRTIGELPWFDAAPLRVVGWTSLAGSMAWMAVAQAQMGLAWRIGIDRANTPMLMRGGLFGWSRNPIFLGLRLNLAGFFMLLPNAFTFALLLAGEALIQVQVRLEEQHLARVFGSAYREYRREVPRWI